MRKVVKNALEKYKKAKNKADNLLGCFEQYDPAKPVSCGDVNTNAVEDARWEQKEAWIKYKILLYTDMGWSQKKIDDRLDRLKKEIRIPR